MEKPTSSFTGLSKLQDFSCEVNNQTDVEDPNCYLKLKVGNNESAEELKLSLNRSGLEVLLDGLHTVQTHLSNVASRTQQSGDNKPA